MLPHRPAMLLAVLGAALLAGCDLPPPPGPGPAGRQRITVLTVRAAKGPPSTRGPAVLLTFHVRNDGDETASDVRISVGVAKPDTVVASGSGYPTSGPSARLRPGDEAEVPVLVVGPATPFTVECFGYTVEAEVAGRVGIGSTVRRCLSPPASAHAGG